MTADAAAGSAAIAQPGRARPPGPHPDAPGPPGEMLAQIARRARYGGSLRILDVTVLAITPNARGQGQEAA